MSVSTIERRTYLRLRQAPKLPIESSLDFRPDPRPEFAAPVRLPATLTIRVDCGLDAIRRYGVRELLACIGVRPKFVTEGMADLYYGRADSGQGGGARVRVARDSETRWRMPPRWRMQGGTCVPFGEGDAPIWRDGRLTFDIFRAAAYWLTLEGERQLSDRDVHGRPIVGPFDGTLREQDAPPVQEYARLLAERLRQWTPGFAPAPTWPGGKRYAVALTHDVDEPEAPRGLWDMILGRFSTDPGERDAALAAWWDERRRPDFWRRRWTTPTRRAEWDFDAFLECERRAGLRSALYFAPVRRGVSRDPDVTYDLGKGRYRRLLAQLVRDGWEIGMHASYRTVENRPAPKFQRDMLSAAAGGATIQGVRHHYLRLDAFDPMRGLNAHRRAGLDYDSSIGFNDLPGFRAGLCLPYRLPGRGPGDLIELPMTLADMHLPRADIETSVAITLSHLRDVRRWGGLAVLNWHVGNWRTAAGWREAYRAACAFLAADADVWVAPPREIAAWWRAGRWDTARID